jgi:uncharacterized protein YecE (DUF72 family)
VGTSGWALPAASRDRFPPGASQLERYAQVFSCVEITSSFYRPHRRSTYERWAATVPDGFRFAVKLPKIVTHDRGLRDAEEPLRRFLDESGGLGAKRAVLLVQLPPRFAYAAEIVEPFIEVLRAHYPGLVAWEPRHPSWFAPEVEAVLRDAGIARVAADPAVVADAGEPGGASGFAYGRWHGSPQIYSSSYGEDRIAALAARIRRFSGDVWCVFDNTRSGAATDDALRLASAVSPRTPHG